MQLLKVAAIGVGSLGRHHARNYAELALEGRVDLVGVCDIDAETATQLAVRTRLCAISLIGANFWIRWMPFRSRRRPRRIARSRVRFSKKAFMFWSKNRSP